MPHRMSLYHACLNTCLLRNSGLYVQGWKNGESVRPLAPSALLLPYLLSFISNSAFCHKKNDEQGSVLDVVDSVPSDMPSGTLTNHSSQQRDGSIRSFAAHGSSSLDTRVLRIVLEIRTGLIQEYRYGVIKVPFFLSL